METSLTWLGRLASAPSDPDWARLVDGYGPLLRGWLARTGVPPTDRDDVVQEVLIVVVRRVAEFEHRGPGAFRAWLRGVVVLQARKYFRTRRSNPAVDLDALASEDSAASRLWDREHDEYHAARAMRVVEGDFAPATWAAFRRQVIDGLPPADAAAELGLTVNAVVLAKSRVLKRLRQELRGLLE
ncbi:MAG: sigma-70 family RNA polymerase sigma factor [Gemmataceae bacterium]